MDVLLTIDAVIGLQSLSTHIFKNDNEYLTNDSNHQVDPGALGVMGHVSSLRNLSTRTRYPGEACSEGLLVVAVARGPWKLLPGGV